MAKETRAAKQTDATVVAARLREEIIRGIVPPGAKLKLVPLAERYAVSRGPLREAVSRLAAEDLVVIEDQKGFRVTNISRQHLTDVTQTRQRIESMALRDAIAHGDLTWEGELLSSLHVLGRVSGVADDEEGQRSFQARHRAFHEALIKACPSVYLKRFCEILYAHTERYRALAAVRYRVQRSARDIDGEHEAIVRAALARDADRACHLLESHFQHTANTLLRDYPSFFEEV